MRKFRDVFALAYTRFLDLQQAEARAREAQVEAALERVRARALGMQKSGDMSQAAAVVFQELRELGFSIWFCGFVIIDEEKDEGEIWYTTPGGEAVQIEGKVTHFSTRPILQGLYAAWKRKDPFYYSDLTGEALEEHYRYLLDVLPYLRSLPAEDFPQRLVSTRALFSQGYLSVQGLEPVSEADLEVVKRFAAAFSLIYTRFLDLQQAEAQAKQQAREAAIERVRAEALSMLSSEDIVKVVAVMWREMVKLGVETPGCSFQFIDEDANQLREYEAQDNPRKHGASWTSSDLIEIDRDTAVSRWKYSIPEYLSERVSSVFADIMERWRRGEAWSVNVNIVESFLSARQKRYGLDQPMSWDRGGDWVVTNVSFRYGFVGFRERQTSDEHVVIVRELTSALELGYLRFLEFEKLEKSNEALSDANKELFAVNKELQQTLEEKEQAQEALVRSENMAAIGTLVAGVAHELNNPLGAAYSLTQTVQEMIEEDTPEQLQQEKAEIVDHLAFSRKELNRAKEIVAALLGLSRQNQDYTEAVELNTVVQDALRVLYNQYKKYDLNLVEEYAEGLPSVQGNFAQLGQVCMNLIKNAIEALKGQEGQIVLRTYRDSGQVVFECADTGPGIPEGVRQRIFQPFFTTKAPGEGTGLGLYICHQTVEKHHGSIEVDSEVGKGTRFRVRLPARS